MVKMNVYLNFAGNCEEAFLFYKSIFGGEFAFIGKFKDMPPLEGMPPLPPEIEEKIMHISLPISNEAMLMGSDTGGEWANSFKEGNNISISLVIDTKEEADRLFNGLSEGGEVIMPMADTFWGEYYGLFIDKFKINWMISYSSK